MYKDIDWDNRRSNIDGSKKRACMQNMDYDGFRQMVLGANLKTIKPDEAQNIYDARGKPGNINPIATYNNIVKMIYL